MISISTNLLAAVAKWASTDEARVNLCMVLFTKGEYVACDGHRLVRVPLEYDGKAFCVGRDHILAAVAAQRSLYDDNDSSIDIEPNGKGLVNLTIDKGIVVSVPFRSAGDYPHYEQVMPKGKPDKLPDPYGFDPQYLAAIDEVNRASDSVYRGVQIVAWGGELDAMEFRNADGIRFVIMPVRT